MVTIRRMLAAGAVAAALASPAASRADGILEQMQNEVAAIVSRAKPAVVSIEDERLPMNRPSEKSEKTEKRPGQNEKPHAGGAPPGHTQGGPDRRLGRIDRLSRDAPKVGSGFAIEGGYVVTTADVLEGMKHPIVRTENGARVRAAVVGIDTELNIGLLKLANPSKVSMLTLGRSSLVAPGHFAISIGNQNGSPNSVALTLVAGVNEDGIVAANHFYPGLIQIAGTVGAGTSGAPILNARGEVIGMIAAIPAGEWTETPTYSIPIILPGTEIPNGPPAAPVLPGGPANPPAPDPQARLVFPNNAEQLFGGRVLYQTPSNGGNAQITFIRPPVTSAGFALPIDDMKPIIKALEENRLAHSWLGVDMVDERKAEENDGVVTVAHAIRVKHVYPGSPAAMGGVQEGDILLSLNEKPLRHLLSIKATLARLLPGDDLEIRISRNGSAQTLHVKLMARPDQVPPPPKS